MTSTSRARALIGDVPEENVPDAPEGAKRRISVRPLLCQT
jgi:hypothetical protein